MDRNKKIIVSLVVVFCCLLNLTISYSFSANIAGDEIVVKSVTPVYDESTGVVLTEDNEVIFNDKNQSIDYNVVIENISGSDLKIINAELTQPTEEFLKYELEGIEKDDVFKANETKELVVSLETLQMEGWGRNFNDELTANITFDKANGSGILENVINPNTSDKSIAIVLGIATAITGVAIIVCSKNKFTKYSTVILVIGSTFTIVSAQVSIVLPIKISASFESQNVMVKAYEIEEEYYPAEGLVYKTNYFFYWEYKDKIKDIYIENEIREIKEYAYKFDVSEKQDGRVIAYLVVRDGDESFYDLYLQADGIIYPNEDASYYFSMHYLSSIKNLEELDTSNVTNMSSMFESAGRGVLNGDIYTELELDLSSFDTSKVTDMSRMFDGVYLNGSLKLDLSNFDTSNVTNMSHMFSFLNTTGKEFELDLSSFNTNKVTDMSSMFSWTGEKSTNLTLDVSNFDTSKVTNMSEMFYETGVSNPNFTLDVSNFDTSKVTNMSKMFYETGASNPNFTLDVSDFDTSKVTDMSSMFYRTGAKSTNLTLDVSNFDTSNVTDMNSMFYGAGYNSTKMNTSITIRNPNLENYEYMFRYFVIKSGSQIKVNYTSETRELVDKIFDEVEGCMEYADGECIAYYSPNIIKGEQVD